MKKQMWDVISFADDEVFQKYDAIANSIYDPCTPSIVPVMEIEEIDGKKIIVANILPGMDKPYYLRADGMMNWTYIRIAGVTRKAEPYMVKELQLEGINKSYDATQAAGEELSAEAINALCERMHQRALSLCKNDDQRHSQRKVTVSQLAQWRILVYFQDKYYSTYAWKLLTGDIDELFPDAFIQMAAFKGKTRAVFQDCQEAKGPIDQQIEEAMVFVKKHINLGSRIAGVYQEDIYKLPLDSVRELISNAVCLSLLYRYRDNSDNGQTMVAQTMVELLKSYGVTSSKSRPAVSNDNAFAESAFSTAKTRPEYPNHFDSLDTARQWAHEFIIWARKHRHSGIKYLTPTQHREGKGEEILLKRTEVFEQAKQDHPERWNNRPVRDWFLPNEVYLNPTKEQREAEKLRKQARNKERHIATIKHVHH